MKTKNRVLSLFLAVLMFASLFASFPPIETYAAETINSATSSVDLKIDTVDAVVGSTIKINITLSNNPGIASLVFKLSYNEAVLELSKVEYNTSMGGQTVQPSTMKSPVTLYWVNGFSNYSDDSVFATLTFNVAQNAKAGDFSDITISYSPDDVYDISETNVNMKITSGRITIIECVPGDINGDNVLNNKDVTRFMQYNAGWDVSVNSLALDVNGDGNVNNKDVTRLMQYNAGWDVEIFCNGKKDCKHTEVVDNEVAPTCTMSGLTEGSHCSVCNEVIKKQEIIQATGHTYIDGICHCGAKDGNYGEDLRYSEGLKYFLSVSGKNYVVEGIGQCKDKDIIIPPEYNGLPVTGISGWAFDGNTEITSVTFPDTFDHIWEYAFRDCTGLTTINIPKNITRILPSAFSGCYNITSYNVHKDNTVYHSVNNCIIETQSKTLLLGCQKSVIPTDGSVTQIGDYAFMGCSNLQNLVIPNSVTSIGYASFSGCSGLSKIRISDNLATIKTGAFSGCEKISSVTLPDKLIEIGSQAFMGCKSLRELVIPINVTTIGEYAFSNCNSLETISVVDGNGFYHDESNCLIETQSKTLLLGCKNSIVPNDGSVTSIGNSAFKGCADLSTILIPSCITVVERSAFEGCTSLEAIQLPDGILSIEGYTFKDCINLSQIILPDSVQEIDTYSFYNCKGLEKFTIPASVTIIQTYTFEGCDNLEELTLPTSIETIETYAFMDLLNLTKINYLGTEQQWNQINKESRWDYNTGGISVAFNYNGAPVTEYTVIFKDYNGAVLKEQTVKSGESATAPVAPARNGYRFVGWDKTFDNVTANVTVTAKYVQQFAVVFKDYDGTILKTEIIDINTNATPPSVPSRTGYTFTGWSGTYTNVTQNQIVIATYNKNEILYTVVFKDYNGNTLKEQTVPEGTGATAPSNPNRAGYRFTGWDKTFDNVISDITVTATYIQQFTVVFKDHDGTTLKTELVDKGTSATPPANPSRDGYAFNGWDNTYTNITSDKTITATYVERTSNYTVTFVDYDETVLKTQTNIISGEGATAPTAPSREGYRFVGWDKSFDIVTSDITVIALYIQQFKVSFVDYNGTVIKEVWIDSGSSATLPTNPSRTGYTFNGWRGLYSNVYANQTVQATYVENSNKATVKITNGTGTVGETVSLYVDLSNNSGFISASLLVDFDDTALKLIAVKDLGIISGAMHTEQHISPYVLTWENDERTSNITANGRFVELVFEISPNASEGVYDITLNIPRDGIINANGQSQSFVTVNGFIAVSEGIRDTHKWDKGTVVTEPTENSTGLIVYTCRVCGETKAEILDKLTPQAMVADFTLTKKSDEEDE